MSERDRHRPWFRTMYPETGSDRIDPRDLET